MKPNQITIALIQKVQVMMEVKALAVVPMIKQYIVTLLFLTLASVGLHGEKYSLEYSINIEGGDVIYSLKNNSPVVMAYLDVNGFFFDGLRDGYTPIMEEGLKEGQSLLRGSDTYLFVRDVQSKQLIRAQLGGHTPDADVIVMMIPADYGHPLCKELKPGESKLWKLSISKLFSGFETYIDIDKIERGDYEFSVVSFLNQAEPEEWKANKFKYYSDNFLRASTSWHPLEGRLRESLLSEVIKPDDAKNPLENLYDK